MSLISPARIVAAKVLQDVDANPHAQAADLLARYAGDQGLRLEDVRLARAIVFGVLRHAPTLDYYFTEHLKQPPHKLLPSLRICLRMATYQRFMLTKIPVYALVNETVELARGVFNLKAPQVAFLNAVLRKISAAEAPPPLPTGNRVSDLSIRFGFPANYVRLLVEKYGTHKAVAIMAASKAEPKLVIRVNTLFSSPEELAVNLAKYGFDITPTSLVPDGLVVEQGSATLSLFETSEFTNGRFYVQDEASQAVAHIAAPQPGETILDMCSAPGGKTTHLAELAKGKAAIHATDISEERLRLVEENLSRLKTPNIQVITLEEALAAGSQYDVVLVDAPCSGAGTVRRNPEISSRLTPEELKRHSERQLAVLDSAASHVRPGGRIVYSTCSISDLENKEVIRRFLKDHPDYQVGDSAELAGTEKIRTLRGPDGFYRTWPLVPEVDGFEAVVLVRTTDVGE